MSLYNVTEETLRVEALLARDIITDSRPGLLRVSPYFYNTIEENAIVIDAIAEILEKRT